MYPPFKGIRKWIDGRTDKDFGRMFNVRTTLELGLIPHGFDHVEQLYGIDIKNAHGIRMVTKHAVVSGKTQHVPYAVVIGP